MRFGPTIVIDWPGSYVRTVPVTVVILEEVDSVVCIVCVELSGAVCPLAGAMLAVERVSVVLCRVSVGELLAVERVSVVVCRVSDWDGATGAMLDEEPG